MPRLRQWIRHTACRLLVVVVLVNCTGIVFAEDDALKAERDEWRATLSALRRGDYKPYRHAEDKLRQYALWPFLEFEKLDRRLAELSPAEVMQFAGEYEHTVVSRILKERYLSLLAKRKNPTAFLLLSEQRLANGKRLFEGSLDTKEQCFRLRALIERGDDINTHDDIIAKIWNHGQNLPDECDPLFKLWRERGGLDRLRVFERVESAVAGGNTRLAGYLGRTWLKPADQKWVDRWIRMRNDPQKTLAEGGWESDPVLAATILKYGIRRVAVDDLETAEGRVNEWFKLHSLSEQDEAWIYSKVGLKSATDHHISAERWLSRVPDVHSSASVREWRIRAALREKRFDRALEFIDRLSITEQAKPKWQYWRARSLAQQGKAAKAREIYAELALTRNFYGFLSADIIGSKYLMNHEAIPNDDPELVGLVSVPGLIAARELFLNAEVEMARRQWEHALSRLSQSEQKRSAILAHQWGWHDRAIITAGRSKYSNDIDVRFPLVHRELVETSAGTNRISPSWVYGVVRQESAFNPQARSHVGALGLMQLMPKTGRRMGQKLNLPIKSNDAIFDIRTNLRLGTAYLRTVLDKNAGHVVLATASYNAGPHKVLKWLPTTGTLDADIWIETIPYSETRNFVKNVLGFTAVYENRLGGELLRLQDRMPPVVPAQKQTAASQ